MSNPPSNLDMALWTFNGPAADIVRGDVWETARLAQVLAREYISVQADLAALRAALVGFVGSDDPTELDAIEVVIRQSGAPLSDMAVAINGIDALRQTRAGG